MTQQERIHKLQRLWSSITARIPEARQPMGDEFRQLDQLIKGLNARPELSLAVNNVVRLRG